MNPQLRIARTELQEHLRQPGMIVAMVASYVLSGAFFITVAFILHVANSDPFAAKELERQFLDSGITMHKSLELMTTGYVSYVFTSMPLFVAIMSGNAVLHERDCGTLPFLLLAPISRGQLLRGKLLGVMALPLLLHFIFGALICLPVANLSTFAPFAEYLGGGGAWWVAYLLGMPIAAALTGALGAVISGLARDVRGAMQTTSFTIGLLSLGFGLMQVNALPEGALLQFVFAGAALVLTLIILAVGARLLSRDVG